MKAIKFIGIILLVLGFGLNDANGQNDSLSSKSIIAGYHVGYVQLIFATDGTETHFLDESKFFTMGFPIGVTFQTGKRIKFDLEFVPFVNPNLGSGRPYSSHLLFHPGVLLPLSKSWTIGARLAFELGNNQMGLTPLINKSFSLGKQGAFFVELVAPMRVGPSKHDSYVQLGGIHLGFAY